MLCDNAENNRVFYTDPSFLLCIYLYIVAVTDPHPAAVPRLRDFIPETTRSNVSHPLTVLQDECPTLRTTMESRLKELEYFRSNMQFDSFSCYFLCGYIFILLIQTFSKSQTFQCLIRDNEHQEREFVKSFT